MYDHTRHVNRVRQTRDLAKSRETRSLDRVRRMRLRHMQRVPATHTATGQLRLVRVTRGAALVKVRKRRPSMV